MKTKITIEMDIVTPDRYPTDVVGKAIHAEVESLRQLGLEGDWLSLKVAKARVVGMELLEMVTDKEAT